MSECRHYGLAALVPDDTYPDFKSGVTLAFTPCDYLVSDEVGVQLKTFLEDLSQPWQRHATRSSISASRELVSKVIAPELAAVSTFTSLTVTPMQRDERVQTTEFTSHAVSDAVVTQLIRTADLQGLVLKEWVMGHAGLLACSGGLVFSELKVRESESGSERSGSRMPLRFKDFVGGR